MKDDNGLTRMKAEVFMVCGMLGSLLDLAAPGLSPEAPLSAGIAAKLPPVVSASTIIAEDLELGLGDLRIDFTSPETTDSIGQACLSVRLRASTAVQGGMLVPTLSVDQFLFDLDGLKPESKRLAEGGIEAATEALLSELLPVLGSLFVEIRLPEILGFHLGEAFAGNDQASGWFVIRGLPSEGGAR